MRQAINVALSWYEATAARPVPTPLQGEVTADVCVVGAGLAGLTTALECAQRKLKVVLLEAGRVCSGASGRNGGFVSNGFAQGMEQVEARVGVDAARSLYRLSRIGTDYVRARITQADASIRMGDGMRVCVRYADDGGLQRHGERMASIYDENVQAAGVAETRTLLDSDSYFDSLYFPDAFHIHPLRYGLMLAEQAAKAGVAVHENSPARAVTREGTGFTVLTPQGRVKAQHVVHCVSSMDTSLHRPSGRAILPVATYVAVTEPLLQNLIRTRSAIADTRRAGDYYRLVGEAAQTRILWGGRITTRISEPGRLAESMKRDMLRTYPKLGDPRIEYAWAGLMGYALHKMPLIGRDRDGQWFATAFGGHGLNTTAMGGLLVARAIADGDDSYRQFTPFAPQWAYGQLGRLGVQGSYWWMQARDRLDEARSQPRKAPAESH